MAETLLNHRRQIRRRVEAAEARCTRQADKLAFIRAQGLDTKAAEILLVQFEQSLTIMREHERNVTALHDQSQRLDALAVAIIGKKAPVLS